MKFFSDFNYNKVYKEILFETFDKDLNLYPLEDIVTSPNEIIVASIVQNNKQIYYSNYCNIKINSIPKIKNDFFIKTYKYHSEIDQINNYNIIFNEIKDQIRIILKINNKTSNNINIEIKYIYNDITITDNINSNQSINDKQIKIQSISLPAIFIIENPEFVLSGDIIEQKVKYYYPDLPNIRGRLDNKVYLNITNSSLIIPNEIPNGSLCIALNSSGNIIRGKTINDLYRFSKNYPISIDYNTSTISIPEKFIIPMNSIIKLVNKQQIIIAPNSIESDFSLIGVYLDQNLNLSFMVLENKQYYNQLIQSINNLIIRNAEDKIFLCFAIINNTGSRIVQYDLFMLNIGGSGGSGGGTVNKNKINTCEREITIQHSNVPPIVQLYESSTKEQIIPQEIRYSSNSVYIKLTDSTNITTCYEIILL